MADGATVTVTGRLAELDARHADASDATPDLEDDEVVHDPGCGRWHDRGVYEEPDPDPGPYTTEELVERAVVLVDRPAWTADGSCQEYPELV